MKKLKYFVNIILILLFNHPSSYKYRFKQLKKEYKENKDLNK